MPRRSGRVVKGKKDTRSNKKDETGTKTLAKTSQVLAEEARQRNLLAPVSRLPLEIVLLVFAYVKDAGTREFKENYGINGANRRDWIRLTHIFRLWREIALCAPSLWSNIHISKRDYKWANAMLQRSQHIPLNVCVNFEGFTRRTRKYKDIDAALSILEDNLGRCKALSLYNVQPEAFNKFFTPSHDASRLRTLRLSVDLHSHSRSMNSIFLSEHTLHVGALSRLTLIACQLDWNSSFLRGLTHLKIRFYISDAKNFLRALPEMTSLELLDLDDTIQFASAVLARPSIGSRSENPISIPTLKYLRILSSMANVAALLSILVLPSTVNVFFSTVLDEQNAEGFTHYVEILDVLSTTFSPKFPPASSSSSTSLSTSPNEIKSFRIIRGQDFPCDLRIQAFRTALTQEDMLTCTSSSSSNIPPPAIDCAFAFEFGFNALEEATVTRALGYVVPLDHVVTLQLIGKLMLPPDLWLVWFGSIAGLRSVLLGDGAALYYISKGLTRRVTTESSSSGNQPGVTTTLLFPALDTILLHDYVLRDGSKYLLDEFTPNLETRRAIGSPIRRVVFIDCDLGGDDAGMLRLKNAVEHVEELELNLIFEEIVNNAVADSDATLEDEDEPYFS